ncbi:glycoside hydrolase family 16 protein [Flavicella sp.]|uniref:glycoside hydrolase family 16 protein n=1 Tax=Flavicella sp. TaxID=2957742 RepID=UPI003018B8DB
MKIYKYLFQTFFIAAALLLSSCDEETHEFGDIISPSNIQVTAEIVGQDTSDLNFEFGDGSGFVNFNFSADNALSYKINYGDGTAVEVAPSGEITKRYTTTGTNTYTVILSAVGTGGVTSTTSIIVTVFCSFEDSDAADFLSGSTVGETKTWYWAANEAGHVGLGPVEDDYGNGEFSYPAWWGTIGAWDEEKYCMYSAEFVFTRTEESVTFEQTVGPSWIPGTYAPTLGVDGDTCYDETDVTDMFGVKNVYFAPSSSKAGTEGSYNEVDYRGTEITIADGGTLGWFVGSSTYDIISITDDKLIVRIIEVGGSNAWYQTFTSTKPTEGETVFESAFNDLVWSDEFDIDGAPNTENWIYDIGTGTNGWGNNEEQTYTNNAENVSVADGILTITAKADGNGGYTSTRLKSQGLQEFTYGRIEARAKLPSGQGTWPAFWILGSNITDVSWPACGEIDIMEQTGADKNSTIGAFHWLDESSSSTASHSDNKEIENASSEFHLYTLEWSEDEIIVLVDNEHVVTLTNSDNLPFNADFFIVLNIAMGGTLGGEIDSNFTEDTYEIDYVRVYQ